MIARATVRTRARANVVRKACISHDSFRTNKRKYLGGSTHLGHGCNIWIYRTNRPVPCKRITDGPINRITSVLQYAELLQAAHIHSAQPVDNTDSRSESCRSISSHGRVERVQSHINFKSQERVFLQEPLHGQHAATQDLRLWTQVVAAVCPQKSRAFQ